MMTKLLSQVDVYKLLLCTQIDSAGTAYMAATGHRVQPCRNL